MVDSTNKFRKALPLAVIIGALMVGGLVYAQFFQTWNFTNNLSTPTSAPTTFTGEEQTFTIGTNAEDDVAQLTITFVKNFATTPVVATTNTAVPTNIKLELKKTTWVLASGYTVALEIKNPDGTTLTTISKTDGITLDSAHTFVQWDSSFTTSAQTGTYKIIPTITNMVWSKP